MRAAARELEDPLDLRVPGGQLQDELAQGRLIQRLDVRRQRDRQRLGRRAFLAPVDDREPDRDEVLAEVSLAWCGQVHAPRGAAEDQSSSTR